MDDAAFAEAVFFKNVLHDLVVVVCINAKMRNLRFTEIQNFSEKIMNSAITGNDVDHTVRRIG